ncbi:hypothetical protein GJ496_002639 [Pomphorhynchus laevis]|nr:hypothetical protein GJ496_002639 [Pomphorhynchus laevis]
MFKIQIYSILFRSLHKHVADIKPNIPYRKTRKRKPRTCCEVYQHAENPHFNDEYSLKGPPLGRIYDKLPTNVMAKKDQVFLWCACGLSRNQPFCDMSHIKIWGTSEVKSSDIRKHRPIRYIAESDGELWFCNCKQTKNRPLCDGTHRSDFVQNSFTLK